MEYLYLYILLLIIVLFRTYLIPSMLGMLAVSAHSFVVGQGVGADAVTSEPFNESP